ncbi:MAG: hypothetical protein AAF689_18445, partial [Pseudomonadota bacterium]
MTLMTARRSVGLLAAMIFVSGCALPPEGTTASDVAKFEAAVATVGCQIVTEAEYLPVELQTGLSREQTTKLAAYMVTTNRAVRLSTGG